MFFQTTTGKRRGTDLHRAFLGPEPEDGSLFVPETIPRIPPAFFNNISLMPLADIAYVVARQLIDSDVDAAVLQKVCRSTFFFPVPMVNAGNVNLLQLWHGPTGSYNDIGALFLRALLDWRHINSVNLIMATMGDSGAAMANAMANRPGTRLTVLYSRTRVNSVLQAQMCREAYNIYPIAVDGSIDNCRQLVSRALHDADLNEGMLMTAANSHSVARFLPHVFYYFHAYSLMRAAGDKRPVTVALPGGNLGNLAAGVLAKQMGVPIRRFIIGTNANNSLEYVLRGEEPPQRNTVSTVAPAIDVGMPSNIPRLRYLYRNSAGSMSGDIAVKACCDDEIVDMLLEMHTSGHTVDSATAAALCAVKHIADPNENVVVLATADPRKEAEGFAALGIKVGAMPLPRHRSPMRMRARYMELREHLLNQRH